LNDSEIDDCLVWVKPEASTLKPSIFSYISLAKKMLESNNNMQVTRILNMDNGAFKVGKFVFKEEKFKDGVTRLIRGI
jgi:hypothetical protein